jgi:hypothetical protein
MASAAIQALAGQGVGTGAESVLRTGFRHSAGPYRARRVVARGNSKVEGGVTLCVFKALGHGQGRRAAAEPRRSGAD